MKQLFHRMIHSLLLRLIFMFAALGAVVFGALFVSWLVFQSISEEMTSLAEKRMPELSASSAVVASTDRTRSLLTSSLIAKDTIELGKNAETAAQVFEAFRTAVFQLPNEAKNEMLPKLEVAQLAVSNLLEARGKEFKANAAMVETLAAGLQNTSVASALVEEANDSAFFEMTMTGEETINVIDETLTRLVDEDFNQLQAALSIRGDVNLLTGLAIAYGQSRNSQVNSIINDLATSALDRLNALVAENGQTAGLQDVLPQLTQSRELYRRVFISKPGAVPTSDILSSRLAVDQVLSPALDDITFNLIIGSDEAKETNKESLTRLLNEEVEGMRLNASLDAATKQFSSLLLQVASAQSPATLALKQKELDEQADEVRRLKAGTEFENQANLGALLALSDRGAGIAAQRLVVFEAQAAALKSSREATLAVDAIAQETSSFSSSALAKIGETAAVLSADVIKAKEQLIQISYIAIAILAIAPVLLWVLVTRPIGRVTRITERLADGDLSEISGLSLNPGELGRMASALTVFRKNALTNIEMQEAERRRERQALEEEKRIEQKRLDDERRQAAEKAEHQEAERQRDAKQAADAESQRQREEARRKERLQEQALIVSTLAQGLNDLASGDLTCKIDTSFPENYDALRQDFNSAIAKLASIVDQLKGSSLTIEGSCAELASASDDLAKRTEVNASTLERTVTTIGELSTSVTESAKGANEASTSIQTVQEKANQNSDVMKQASAAMARVEESSNRISSIVGLIESVAFQTNLLALNAGVEAARAGEAGQGFAVVANEVRVLAQRCSEAANDIKLVVEESVSTVHEGVVLTEEANTAMKSLNEDFDQISRIIKEIANSADRQSDGLNGVNDAVKQLDRSTQQNAAMFEETTASNRMLSAEASVLSEVVASFKLDQSPTNEMEKEVA